MAFNLEWVKEHPVYTAGIVGVGVVVVFLYMRGGSSAPVATGDPNAGAELAYAAQSQQIQGALSGQASAQNFQLEAKSADLSAQKYATDASVQVALAKLSADAETTSKGYELALQENINATETQRAAISATATQSANALTVQQNIMTISANEQTNLATISAATTQRLAELQSSVGMAQISAQEYISGLNNYTAVVNSNNYASVAINASNRQAEVGIAQTRAAVDIAGQKASSSIWGSIIGAVGSVAAIAVSDEMLKANIVKVGRAKGFNIYEFNYYGDPIRYRGVMAREVARKRPDAIVMVHHIMAVNYAKLGLTMSLAA